MLVLALEGQARRALDGNAHALQREAALLVELGLACRARRSPDSRSRAGRPRPVRTRTAARSTPTCVAARPTPCASSIRTIMRSTRRRRSSSKSVTSFATSRNALSGYCRICARARRRRASASASARSSSAEALVAVIVVVLVVVVIVRHRRCSVVTGPGSVRGSNARRAARASRACHRPGRSRASSDPWRAAPRSDTSDCVARSGR